MSPRKPSSDPLLRAGDIRVATDSLYAGTRPAGDHVDIRDDALLAMPVLSAGQEALQNARAARHVARRTMLAAHGCTGANCRSAGHAADRGVRNVTLMALGLIEDPESASHTDWWGRRVRPKNSSGEAG